MTSTKQANPAPLGLLGFGLTTILLNLHNANLIDLTVVILAMGIALGGIAQVIAGLLEFKAGKTFGGTAFCAYGLFWISLSLIWVNKDLVSADLTSMGYYLLLWGLFTVFMFIGTLKHQVISRLVFGSLAILFLMLALGDFTGEVLIKNIAGWIGIICGLLAFYNAVGLIINEEFQKDIFPL